MRIGLNATCYNNRPSGARQRFVGLYGCVIAQNPDIEFIVYNPVDATVSAAFASAPNVRAVATPIPSSGRLRKAWAGLGFWQQRLASDRLDLFEHFNRPLVTAPNCPTILTVHDIRDSHGGWASPLRLLYRLVSRRALARADHVITVSETMKREILDFQASTPVTVIYNGLTPGVRHVAADRGGDGSVLAVGHLEPRKNYATLIRAMATLRRRGRPIDLTIVGHDAGSLPEIRALVAANDLADQVVIRSDVDDATLAGLYADCRMLVFPSRYEGFGIPIIEAMAARRPVVTSDIAVFREITGDRGVYFGVDDAEGLADAIVRVSDDRDLVRALVDYGDHRIAEFDYTAIAPRVSRLYREILDRTV